MGPRTKCLRECLHYLRKHQHQGPCWRLRSWKTAKPRGKDTRGFRTIIHSTEKEDDPVRGSGAETHSCRGRAAHSSRKIGPLDVDRIEHPREADRIICPDADTVVSRSPSKRIPRKRGRNTDACKNHSSCSNGVCGHQHRCSRTHVYTMTVSSRGSPPTSSCS